MSFKSRLSKVRTRVQEHAGPLIARGLLYGGMAAGAVIGGAAGEAVGGAAGTTLGSAFIKPADRRKFVKRGLMATGGAAAGLGALSLAAGTGLSTPALSSISSLFGSQKQPGGIASLGKPERNPFDMGGTFPGESPLNQTAPSASGVSGFLGGAAAQAALGLRSPNGSPNAMAGQAGPGGQSAFDLLPGFKEAGQATGPDLMPLLLVGGGLAALILLS